MVEDRAVERFGDPREPARNSAITVTGRRIAARMIVRKDYGSASVGRRIQDDLAKRKLHSGLIARVTAYVKASPTIIDVSDPQTFPAWVEFRETAGEEGFRDLEPIQLQRGVGTLIPHAFSLTDRGPKSDVNRVEEGPKPIHFEGKDAAAQNRATRH